MIESQELSSWLFGLDRQETGILDLGTQEQTRGTETMSYATYEEQMMTEALEEHDKGCCTQNEPCTLRVGVTRALASHKLTPDFRVREERKEQNGKGTGWTGQKKTVSPTEPQSRFWASLMSQLRELGQEELASALEDEWNGVKVFKNFSALLDTTKTRVHQLKKAQPKVQANEGLTEGMYKVVDQVFKVKRSQAGYLYAMELTEEGFQFAKGAIRNIKPEHRMTLEEAKKYGRQTGMCCVCGRELTNETSIREGIGPVCGGRI